MAMMMMTSTLPMQMDGTNMTYDSYAMRRAPEKTQIHMTQQMTTKVAPAYDGKISFFASEDALDDWCDITELEPEKPGPALRNRLEGDALQYKRLLDRDMLRDPNEGVNYFKRFLRPHFIKGAQSPERVFIPFHAVHEVQQRIYGSSEVDDKISTHWQQTYLRSSSSCSCSLVR